MSETIPNNNIPVVDQILSRSDLLTLVPALGNVVDTDLSKPLIAVSELPNLGDPAAYLITGLTIWVIDWKGENIVIFRETDDPDAEYFLKLNIATDPENFADKSQNFYTNQQFLADLNSGALEDPDLLSSYVDNGSGSDTSGGEGAPITDGSVIYGTEQSDRLIGTLATEEIYGYGGYDTLGGSAGNDALFGGGDDDMFVFTVLPSGLVPTDSVSARVQIGLEGALENSQIGVTPFVMFGVAVHDPNATAETEYKISATVELPDGRQLTAYNPFPGGYIADASGELNVLGLSLSNRTPTTEGDQLLTVLVRGVSSTIPEGAYKLLGYTVYADDVEIYSETLSTPAVVNSAGSNNFYEPARFEFIDTTDATFLPMAQTADGGEGINALYVHGQESEFSFAENEDGSFTLIHIASGSTMTASSVDEIIYQIGDQEVFRFAVEVPLISGVLPRAELFELVPQLAQAADTDLSRPLIIYGVGSQDFYFSNYDGMPVAQTDDLFIFVVPWKGETIVVGIPKNLESGAALKLNVATDPIAQNSNFVFDSEFYTKFMTGELQGFDDFAAFIDDPDNLFGLAPIEYLEQAPDLTNVTTPESIDTETLTYTKLSPGSDIFETISSVPADFPRNINAGDGNDFIQTGLEQDLISAGAGNDAIFLWGSDVALAGSGDDRLEVNFAPSYVLAPESGYQLELLMNGFIRSSQAETSFGYFRVGYNSADPWSGQIQAGGQIDTDYGSIWINPFNNGKQIGSGTLFFDGGLLGAMVQLVEADEGLAASIILYAVKIVDGVFEQRELPNGNYTLSSFNLQADNWLGDLYSNGQNQFTLSLPSGHDVGAYNYINNSPALGYKQTNLYVDGGENFDVLETANTSGDFQLYDGADFAALIHKASGSTVKLLNVEEIAFANETIQLSSGSGSYAAPVTPPDVEYYVESYLTNEGRVTEQFVRGSEQDDVIIYQGNMDGGAGNDILVEDFDPELTPLGDKIEGGKGNDFIDGGAIGESGDSTKDLNRAIFDGPAKNFTFETLAYSAGNDKTQIDDLISSLGLAGAEDYLVDGQDYIIVTDSRGDSGLGTDILANIQVLEFEDRRLTLEASLNTKTGTEQIGPNNFYVSPSMTAIETGVMERPSRWIPNETEIFSDSYGWDVYEYSLEGAEAGDTYVVFFRRYHADAPAFDGYVDGPVYTRSEDGVYAVAQIPYVELQALGSSLADDIIDASAHPDGPTRSFISGDGGNDILLGTDGRDQISGGSGNDFIDARGEGQQVDQINYQDIVQSRFDISSITYAGDTNKAELEALLEELGLSSALDYLVEGQQYLILDDKRGNNGVGTDIIANVETIAFKDNWLNLKANEWVYVSRFDKYPNDFYVSADDVPVETGVQERLWSGGSTQSFSDWHNGQDFGWDVYAYDYAEGDPEKDYFVFFKRYNAEAGSSEGYIEGPIFTRNSSGQYIAVFDSVAELNAQGSAYLDDVIDAANHPDAPGRANIEGYGGNDILIATTGADSIRGGEGNDFIDGRGSASKVNQWDNDYVRYEGAFSQYDLIYYDMSDAANVEALQSRLDELGIVVGDYFNDEAAFYIEVSDQLSGRDGTDIVTGVDQLEFNDQSLRLGVYERTYEQEQHVRTPWSYRPSEGESALETIESYRDPWGNEQQKYAGVQGVWKVYVYNDEDPNTDYYVVYNEVEEDWGSYGWVRSLVTRENDGNGGYYYREATETITRFDADGSYFNDVITSDADDVNINAQAGDDYIAVTGSGWIDAGDGNDIIFGGARQNDIRGGAGNDIIVGGGDGEAGNDALQDRAHYQGEQKFFDVKQVRFLGEPMSIKDAIGNKVYQISLSATGAGELRYSGGEEIVLELALGESFIVVTDLLPAKFGGQGVDILSGIESIEFEGDQSTSIDTSVYFYDDAWSNQTEAQGSVFDDMIDLRAGRAINVDAVVERGSSASDIQVEGKLHASNIRGNAGDDIMLGGYGRDFFNPGKGDDFIDGGSASDLEDLIATLTPYRADVTLIDPQSSIEGTFNVYRVHNNGYDFWALRADDNSLFRIRYDEPSDSFSTPDLNEQNNDRWANNDTVQYSGTKLRYEISTVYLKLDESGIAVRDLDGNYDVIEESAFAGEEGYERFFRVKDVLPDAAGGVGTDYLRNIEELYFSDGSEQLAVIADSWVDRYDRNDWSWQPPRNADWSYDLSSAIDTIASYQNMWGGENQNNSTNSQWVVFAYNDADGNPITQDNGQQLFIIWNSQSDEGGGNWGWSERLVTRDGNGGYTEAFYTQARSSVRGTFADDAIDQTADIQSNDQIHGDAGDDLILAGDGRDRIQGGMGNDVIWGGDQNSYGWEFDGDVAFYKGPQSQYLITRDIFVRADENGVVETDAKGHFVVYAEEPVSGKGITSGTTELALTAENGFLSAVIVTDTLPDSQDGEGVDILIGIEGLVFGIDNDWLPSVGSHTRSGDSIGDGGIFISLSSTFNVESEQGGNNGNETIIRVNIYGTDFDDDIQLPDSDSIIFNSQGIGYPASLISFANFSADAGDDSYIGRDGVYSKIRYLGSSEDYELTSNLDGSINIRDLELGDDNTGTDTLINIDRVYFEGDHQHIDLSTSNYWQGYGNNYNGTQFNDVLDGRAGLSFNTQDNDYSGNNGYAPTLSDDMLGFRDDFSAGAGNDILLGGYGGDSFAAGEGDDYMDGGRDDDLAAILAVSTPIAQGVMLVDPQDSVEAGFEIHSVLNGELEYWAVRDDGSYFRVNAETQAGETLSFETVDFGSQNNNWYALDRVNYSGPKARYNIDEVYVKIDVDGLPIRTDDGYQALEIADYQDEADFIKVIRVTDRLPIEAGGTGVDYLRNIDEISFSDGVERLAVQNQIWSERHEQNDWNWRPTEIAGGYDLTSGEEITSYEGVWADTWTDVVSKENQSWDNSTWLVFRYTDENGTPISIDGEDIYVLWHSHQDESGNNNWGWSVGLMTRTENADGSIVYSQTFSTQYRGNIRATLADDVIDQAAGDLDSNDEIFAYAGDDVIYAGDGRDRIKGGAGNDVIYGGGQSSFDGGFKGDLAYYSEAIEQFKILTNVYVKPLGPNGRPEVDAQGRFIFYSEDTDLVGRGIIRQNNSDELIEANGYLEAVIVIDTLADDLGGEGVDVLIGVEGLVFDSTVDYLPHVWNGIQSGTLLSGGAKFAALKGGYTISSHNDTQIDLLGTDFDDSLTFVSADSFFDGTRSYSVDSFGTLKAYASAGNDVIDVRAFEETITHIAGRAMYYTDDVGNYKVSRNEDGSLRVEHLVEGDRSTGVDTLYGFGEITWHGNLTSKMDMSTNSQFDGSNVHVSPFGDQFDADNQNFVGIQDADNEFHFTTGFGNQTFIDAGLGQDSLLFEYTPIWQTNITINDGVVTITDNFGSAFGSIGTVVVDNAEELTFTPYEDKLRSHIDLRDLSNIQIEVNNYGDKKNYVVSSLGANGELLNADGGLIIDDIKADIRISSPDGNILGTDNDDVIHSNPGDQIIFAGDGSGDQYKIHAVSERYIIEYGYDLDALGDGLFDETGVEVNGNILKVDGSNASYTKFVKVSDKLSNADGGTGSDLLFGFENIHAFGFNMDLSVQEYSGENYFEIRSPVTNDIVYVDTNIITGLEDAATPQQASNLYYNVQFGSVIIGSNSSVENFFEQVIIDGNADKVGLKVNNLSSTDSLDLNSDGIIGDAEDLLISDVLVNRGYLEDGAFTQIVLTEKESSKDPLVLYGIDEIRIGQIEYNLTVTKSRNGRGEIDTVRGTELSDILIGDNTGNYFYSGVGTDFIDGISNVENDDQYWRPRDYLRFNDWNQDGVEFERAEFVSAQLVVNEDGNPALDADNKYQVVGYTGEAAIDNQDISFVSSVELLSLGYGQEIVSVSLISDRLSSSDEDYFGVKIIRNIDTVEFKDRSLDLSVFENVYEQSYGPDNQNSYFERQLYGTILGDVMIGDGYLEGGARDYLEGRDGDDVLVGGAWGDNLDGGYGDDILDGGANGMSGDSWRDADVARYNQNPLSRYTISKVYVAADFDATQDIVEIYDPLGLVESAGKFNLNQNADDYAAVSDTLKAAYLVVDALGEEFGGTGHDLVIDVERLEFKNGESVDLALRIERNDWDENRPGYERVYVYGTNESDDITSYSNGLDYDGDGNADDDLIARNEIDARDGNDIIFTYGGGDWIKGGDGSDFIDGGANGNSGNSWDDEDRAVFDGKSSRYSIEGVTKASETLQALAAEIGVDLSAYDDTQEFTLVKDVVGKDGNTDILVNIERIQFSDKDIAISPSVWIERNENGDEVRRNIEGSVKSDILLGGQFNDYIRGNQGDDIIMAGDGGDDVNPGKGTDYIDGGQNNNYSDDTYWSPTDSVRIDAKYEHFEVEKAKIVISGVTEQPLADANGKWTVIGYNGEAALISNKLAFFDDEAGFNAGEIVDVYLISDNRAPSDSGYLGVNIIRNVENLSFNDKWVQIDVSKDSHQWTDWNGNTVIENRIYGTIFSESLIGDDNIDFIEGREGDDYIFGAGGGDRLYGGRGNDIIIGGENGNTGDSWRDLDMVEYWNESYERFQLFKVKVDTAQFDDEGYVAGQVIEIVDAFDVIDDALELDGYTIVSQATGELVDAYILSDYLPGELGGMGNDLLIGVEQLQFNGRSVDLGIKLWADDWDQDGTLDYVRVEGTGEADDIRDWGSEEQQKADGEIVGKAGDDVLFGYAGGDRLVGGSGNDFIDGGTNGEERYGWTPKDEAFFNGKEENYIVTQYNFGDETLTQLAEDLGYGELLASYAPSEGQLAPNFTVVQDTKPAQLGGSGIDILVNVEFIGFQDKYISLSVESNVDMREDYDYDGDGYYDVTGGSVDDPEAVTQYAVYWISGTSSGDQINGGIGDDNLNGNGGDDVITAGAGGDYIEPGKGNDFVDGGDNGTFDWNRDDVVRFNGNIDDYELTTGFDDLGRLEVVVSDLREDGEGVNTLVNVERIDFNDQSLSIGVSSRADYGNGNVIRGYVYEGSAFDDIIEGTIPQDSSSTGIAQLGNDYIDGGDGDDVLYGFAGQDSFVGGRGDDLIYGGENGVDQFGNEGGDTVIYHQNFAQYTITYKTVEGEDSDEYVAGGYVIVSDIATDEFSDGTDELRGVERLVFADSELTFEAKVKAVDSDGDGIPDIAVLTGTMQGEELIGSGLDETFSGNGGDDVLYGLNGDDRFENYAGDGNDIYVGGEGTDRLTFDRNADAFSIQNIIIALDQEGKVVTDSAGKVEVYDAVESVQGELIAKTATQITDTSLGEVDIVTGVEYVEFDGDLTALEMSTGRAKYAGDGSLEQIDIFGTLGNDVISSDGLVSFGFDEQDAQSIFAADNFIFAGKGVDIVDAGAGNDQIFINSKSSGSGTDIVRGGDGVDTLNLAGSRAEWSFELVDQSGESFSRWFSLTQEVLLDGIEILVFDDKIINLVQTRIEIDRNGDGVSDGVQLGGTLEGDILVADSGAYRDVLRGGEGDDILIGLAGNDAIIEGLGDDLIIGGAGQDRVSYNLTQADVTITKSGYALRVADSGGYIVSISDGVVGLADETAITFESRPLIFAEVVDAYLGLVSSDFDVDGDAETQDLVQIDTDGDGEADSYFADLDHDGEADRFADGADSAAFDPSTMTLQKIMTLSLQDGTLSDIYADYVVEEVFEVASIEGTDTLIALEYVEFSDQALSLLPERVETSFFSAEEGLVQYWSVEGTSFSDVISLTADDEVVELGVGNDVLKLASGSGVDVVVDFNAKIDINTYYASVASDFDANDDEKADVVSVDIDGDGESDGNFADLDGDGVVDAFDAGADDVNFDPQTMELVEIAIIDDSYDVVRIEKLLNGTSISSFSTLRSRMSDTSDGVQINLGVDEDGIAQQLILEDVTVDELSAFNFQFVDIL